MAVFMYFKANSSLNTMLGSYGTSLYCTSIVVQSYNIITTVALHIKLLPLSSLYSS